MTRLMQASVYAMIQSCQVLLVIAFPLLIFPLCLGMIQHSGPRTLASSELWVIHGGETVPGKICYDYNYCNVTLLCANQAPGPSNCLDVYERKQLNQGQNTLDCLLDASGKSCTRTGTHDCLHSWRCKVDPNNPMKCVPGEDLGKSQAPNTCTNN